MMNPILQMRKPRQGGGKEDPRGRTTYEGVPADWNCHHRGAWLGSPVPVLLQRGGSQ